MDPTLEEVNIAEGALKVALAQILARLDVVLAKLDKVIEEQHEPHPQA